MNILRTLITRTVLVLLAFVFAYLSPCSSGYVAHATETIPSFEAHIAVNANATIEVEERITYNFGSAEQHGIFRTIPYSYQAGSETYTAQISSVIVHDEKGNPLPFNESRGNGELTIKIGDPNKTVTGEHTYAISYVVAGPVLYFDDYDEFYWNVTGSWPKNGIEQATVLVDLPVGAQALKASCYQGDAGSQSSCTSDEKLVSEERGGYTARAQKLEPGQGFSIAIAFPKGVVDKIAQPWDEKPISPWKYSPFIIPLVVLVSMLRVWYVRGRDPKANGTIVTQFDPPQDLTPAVAGTLYNELAEPRELSAEIVRLAVEGYLKIHRIEEKTLLILSSTDYLLERRDQERVPKDAVGALLLQKLFQSQFEEKKIVNGLEITGTLLSKMQHKFVSENNEIQELLYREVVLRGYFAESPNKVRFTWMASGLATVTIGVALAVLELVQLSILGMALALSGAIIALVGWFMPVKTPQGARVLEHLEGFKRYLEVAEKDRLAFHHAPEKSPELFDKFLPYAIMFAVEEKWAEQFEGIYMQEPAWYSGGASHAFVASSFASDLTSFTDTVSSASAPQSSGSGGGGSVGGGFGGGGGGSW
jgi:uncharacterized membrane protein YgcG